MNARSRPRDEIAKVLERLASEEWIPVARAARRSVRTKSQHHQVGRSRAARHLPGRRSRSLPRLVLVGRSLPSIPGGAALQTQLEGDGHPRRPHRSYRPRRDPHTPPSPRGACLKSGHLPGSVTHRTGRGSLPRPGPLSCAGQLLSLRSKKGCFVITLATSRKNTGFLKKVPARIALKFKRLVRPAMHLDHL